MEVNTNKQESSGTQAGVVGAQVEGAEARAVQNIVKELVKTLKALKLYMRNNHIVETRLKVLCGLMSDFLGQNGELTQEAFLVFHG